MVKGDEAYSARSSSHDLIWLLKQVKKITSGVDVKSNPRVTMFQALLTIFNMTQQGNESNDSYMRRFESNVHTAELAKGGHVFCSHELVSCEDK